MKNPLQAKVPLRPIGNEWAGGAADIHHGVVNGEPEGADIFLGSAGGSADDARFYEGDAERGKKKNDPNKQCERNGVANGREPG